MASAYANSPAVAPYDFGLRRFLLYSIVLHIALAAAILLSVFFEYRGNAWGGVGGASEGSVKVNLVGSAGVPMPQPPVVSESKTFDPTNGLYKEPPQPKPPTPPPPQRAETKIPQFQKEQRPKQIQHPSRVFDDKTPPPDNAVPYGSGGTPKLPTGYSQAPGAPSGGVAVQGQGGGDFAARYPWYVEAIRRRIAQNWIQSSIDPAARASSTIHAVAIFTIARDGTVKDVRVTQTSGNASFDNSGLRAVLASSPMPPLPNDYSGSYVAVTFDFLPLGTQ
jgi:protein TonB